jgi:hypothetical protein
MIADGAANIRSRARGRPRPPPDWQPFSVSLNLASPSSRRVRRSRAGRCRRARLGDPLILNTPVVSDKAPYQKPESREERRQPRPDPGLVGPSTGLIVAVRIGVAGIRHAPFLFLGPTDLVSKLLTDRNVPARTASHARHDQATISIRPSTAPGHLSIRATSFPVRRRARGDRPLRPSAFGAGARAHSARRPTRSGTS